MRRAGVGIQLQYRFDAARRQQGGSIENPLFELLQALRQGGSIQKASRGLQQSYRHVWGSIKRWEEELGEPLVTWSKGQPAQLTPFAERLLWAETRARARLTPHIEALRIELERVWQEAHAGQRVMLDIFASHDSALTALQKLASDAQELLLDIRFCGSVDALQALADRRCSVAGFHVPVLPQGSERFAAAMKPRLEPGVHKLMAAWRRTQGLMVAPGNPRGLRSLADVLRAGVRFMNRQPGSGTRLLTEHLMAEQGLQPGDVPAWYGLSETSHVAVAAAVAAGEADAGVGIAAAAQAFGLHFVPLVEEDYFLVCLKDSLETDTLERLRITMASQAWALQVAQLPGYAPHPAAGDILSLTMALPWWHFSQPRARGAGRPLVQDQGRNQGP